MLDVTTLLFALVLNDLVLAASLWLAVPRGARLGTGRWCAALALQAVGFGLFAVRSSDPQLASIVAVNLASSLSLAMQASALLAFHHRKHAWWWTIAPPLAIAAGFGACAAWPVARAIAGGVVYGTASLGLALLALRLQPSPRPLGSRLNAGAFFAASAVLFARAIAGALKPELMGGLRGGTLPVASTLGGQAVTLLTSLGFLLMQRERQEQEIARLAMTDALTGVYNRRTLFELGEKELSRARRDGSILSVVILDLDHFKHVNDTHGHLTGDAVLKRFVEIVQGCLRGSDVLTRYGGEEFCVLLPGAPESAARAVAERIRATLESSPIQVEDLAIRVTSSAGVATLAPSERPADQTLSKLVRRADEALYAAKRDGRNRVVVAAA
jgi:diguanylate cyclase (GGDEF)-like protein